LVSHVAEAATTLQPWLSQEDLFWPFVGLGRFYQGQGAYAQAEPWYQGCLSATRSRLGDSPAETLRERHPLVATNLNNLAALYYAQGRYDEAEPLYHQALAILAEAVGTDHPNFQTVFSNFVAFLRAVVEANQTDQLSAHPLVKHLLAEIGVA
jgi:tetratricopeptide (TPR) repeat protein